MKACQEKEESCPTVLIRATDVSSSTRSKMIAVGMSERTCDDGLSQWWQVRVCVAPSILRTDVGSILIRCLDERISL